MILPNLAVAPLQVLASIGMAQNYYGALVDPTGPLSIHWSLAVEEHFYLAYPLLLGLAWGRATALRVGGIGLALVLPLLARLWLALDHPAGAADYVYRATETRLDSIAWGCALALLLMRQETVRVGLVVGAAGLALLLAALVIRDPLFQASWRYSMQGIGLALLIAWTIRPVTETIVHRALAAWPMALIGRLSFSIYLLHLPMIALAEHLGVGIPGALVLILTASALSYEFVERPFLGGKAPSIKGMISRRAFQVERPLSRGSSELRGSKVP
jgi:peptidoglycan/LPS O-acetylase OafA/YrhL